MRNRKSCEKQNFIVVKLHMQITFTSGGGHIYIKYQVTHLCGFFLPLHREFWTHSKGTQVTSCRTKIKISSPQRSQFGLCYIQCSPFHVNTQNKCDSFFMQRTVQVNWALRNRITHNIIITKRNYTGKRIT